MGQFDQAVRDPGHGRQNDNHIVALVVGFSHPELLGDVVISIDTAVREAETGAIPAEQRFYELLVHGILHLFGYDHIHSEEEAALMEAKSRELLSLIGHPSADLAI